MQKARAINTGRASHLRASITKSVAAKLKITKAASSFVRPCPRGRLALGGSMDSSSSELSMVCLREFEPTKDLYLLARRRSTEPIRKKGLKRSRQKKYWEFQNSLSRNSFTFTVVERFARQIRSTQSQPRQLSPTAAVHGVIAYLRFTKMLPGSLYLPSVLLRTPTEVFHGHIHCCRHRWSGHAQAALGLARRCKARRKVHCTELPLQLPGCVTGEPIRVRS